MNREELAWAAGLFDGEGTVRAFKEKRVAGDRWYVRLSVAQGHPAVLERFIAAVGFGKLNGPYRARGRKNVLWSATVDGHERAQAAVGLLWRWLSPVKRAQARQALSRVHGQTPLRCGVPHKAQCSRGHERTEHARQKPNGQWVCLTCHRITRRMSEGISEEEAIRMDRGHRFARSGS